MSYVKNLYKKEYFERPCPACNELVGITDAGVGIGDLWCHGGCSGWLDKHIKKVREGFVRLDVESLTTQLEDILEKFWQDEDQDLDDSVAEVLSLLGMKGKE